MDIFNRIMQAKTEFTEQTDVIPNSLRIGRAEWEELTAVFEDYFGVEYVIEEGEISNIAGMRIGYFTINHKGSQDSISHKNITNLPICDYCVIISLLFLIFLNYFQHFS